jgi:hypothetical protein
MGNSPFVMIKMIVQPMTDGDITEKIIQKQKCVYKNITSGEL